MSQVLSSITCYGIPMCPEGLQFFIVLKANGAGVMSKRKRRINHKAFAQSASGAGIRATMGRPFAPAAISVASMVLTTGALAQSSETLPTIDVQAEGGGGYQATNSSIGR